MTFSSSSIDSFAMRHVEFFEQRELDGWMELLGG